MRKRGFFRNISSRALRRVTLWAVILVFFCLSSAWGFPPSITGGEPKGAFGSGGQTDDVTEPGNWRWSEWFYGHRGIDLVKWRYDACGEWHNYTMGWHGGDLIEYLMKFGGGYSRLILLGIADRPGPVELAIYVDAQYKAGGLWDNNNDCNQLVTVDIPGIPYGTHAIAVEFVNDYYNPPEDRNFFLDALLVRESPGIPSVTGGEPKGVFGSGGQTDDVTEPGNWRWSEWFYGHRGIDLIKWRYDACGEWHNYAMGWHGGDLIEYLMKFGGDYRRLILRGIADRPGPVELAIYVDGQYEASAAWDNHTDCNQDVRVDIGGIPYGTHAIAVEFTNDYYNPPEDRNFFLDGLLVEAASAPPPPPSSSPLYGLCVNANYPEQNPPASEFSELGVHWARSIRYQSGFTPNQRNVKWLVIFNQETIPRRGGETWSNYVERFSHEVRNIVQANDWISAVEVWNEQDLPGEGRYLTPQEYAGLLRATYQKVKGLSGPPIVVVGGLATGAWAAADYLQQVKNEWGGAIYFDAVGLHPYLAMVDGIGWPDRGLMEDHINHFYTYTSGRPIWLTEFGAAYQHLDNDKEKQGLYLERCYELFERLKDGDKRKVEVAFWFAWDDRTHWDPAAEGYGLVELDHSRRPAWWRYYGLTHQ